MTLMDCSRARVRSGYLEPRAEAETSELHARTAADKITIS